MSIDCGICLRFGGWWKAIYGPMSFGYIVQTLELNTKFQKPAIKLILWRVEQRDTIDINGKCLSAVTLSVHNWNGVQCNCDPFYPENWWFIHAKINNFESFINRKFSNTNRILLIDFFLSFSCTIVRKMNRNDNEHLKIGYAKNHLFTIALRHIYRIAILYMHAQTYTVHWFIYYICGPPLVGGKWSDIAASNFA